MMIARRVAWWALAAFAVDRTTCEGSRWLPPRTGRIGTVGATQNQAQAVSVALVDVGTSFQK